MARSEARIYTAIWEDPNFLTLSPTAQRMFMFLVSQKDLAHDGVIALRERRWSKSASGLSADSIARDIAELAAGSFVVVDDDAEELLVRSFIRRDKVYRQPNVLRAAMDHLTVVSSPAILAAIRSELLRILAFGDLPKDTPDIVESMLATITERIGNPSGNPSPNPSGKGSPNPSGGECRSDVPQPPLGRDDLGTGSSPDSGQIGSGPDEPDVSRNSATSDKAAGEKGSENPSRKGSELRPGERGVVTAVTTDSPFPVPRAVPPPAADAPPAPPGTPPSQSVTQRSKRITDAYADEQPMCRWPAINGIVIKAIKTRRWADDEIRDALLRLAKEGRTVTVESLRVELDGLPPGRASPGGTLAIVGQPRPSTTDQRVNAALAIADQFRERTA